MTDKQKAIALLMREAVSAEVCRGVVVAIGSLARQYLDLRGYLKPVRQSDYLAESALRDTMMIIHQMRAILASHPMPRVTAKVCPLGIEEDEILVEIRLSWGKYSLVVSPAWVNIEEDERDNPLLSDCPSPADGIGPDLYMEITDCLRSCVRTGH